MDEDEDAFLYGDDTPADAAASKASGDAQVKEPAAAAATTDAQDMNGEAEEDEEEEGEDDDEDEDSDSDLEIIVDSSTADAKPPPGYNQRPLATFNKTLQAQKAAASAISPEYTPLTRPGQTNATAASLAAAIGLPTAQGQDARKPLLQGQSTLSASQTHALQQQQQLQGRQLPEGPPPLAPSTAPQLELEPSEQSLMIPPDVVGGEPGPIIYHVDPSEMDEKPWRRPGADMTDWFNYGFSEETWRAWGDKKTSVARERMQMERDGLKQEQYGGYNQNQQQQQQQQQFGSSSMSMPPQQMQMMQAMAAASGMNMPPDQMMAFMGMGGGGGQMGMPGMGGMGGGMFPFGGGMGGGMMPPQQQQQHQQHQQHQQGPPPSMQGGFPTQPPGANGGFEHRDPGNEDGEASYEPPAAEVDPSIADAPTGPAIPTGPRADLQAPQQPGSGRSKSPLPQNVPTGPKKQSTRKYNDRDTGTGAADSLDYGGGGGGATRGDRNDREHSRGPSMGGGGWDDTDSGSHSRRGPQDTSPRRGHRSHRSEVRDDDATPRSSSRHDDDESTSHRGSTRERERGDRRRGSGQDGGWDDDEVRDGERKISGSAARASRSGGGAKDRNQARAERRAGRDAPLSPPPQNQGRSQRTRKRSATNSSDTIEHAPRESRRRR